MTDRSVGRTNYFTVTDAEALMADLHRHGIVTEYADDRRSIEVRSADDEPNVVSLVNYADEWPYLEEAEVTLEARARLYPERWPLARMDEGEEALAESIHEIISRHITPGEVAVLIEARTGEDVECFDAGAALVTSTGVVWSMDLTRLALKAARRLGATSPALEM